ncbi:MAG TPA: cobalamin-binding protein [Candidatus Limnocylindrales bacterium]|nr:cobalamin-binding protein [Candidatus Limnocylindrales bacterium]
MRIVSFLPAATEITYALGAGDELVGRSHECDYPPQVRSLPVVSKPALPLEGLSQQDIDRAVSAHLATGESLYQVDEVLLDQLRPDIVFTQDLCQVCAPSGNELGRALSELSHQPQVLSLTPRNLAEISENILAIGEAIGRRDAALQLLDDGRDRIHRVVSAVKDAIPRPVAFLEWTEPLFCAGHWVPEMVSAAGGDDPLGQPGGDSRRMTWDDVAVSPPEMIIVAPCGYGLKEAVAVAKRLPRVVDAEIYAVDANAYFARPGPRVAEGVELLAHLFHPDRFAWPHQHQPWARIA